MSSASRLSQAQTIQPTCAHCGKTYVKNAHLNRHIATKHTPTIPLVCQFCQKVFRGRTDVLRGHYKTCDARGSQPIPPPLERGRKRHACDECSRLKVKCDNQEPSCSKCVEFDRICVKTTRTEVMSLSQASSPRGSMPADPGRSSINFLLNSPGEGDFIRAFPGSEPSADLSMANGFNYLPMLPTAPETHGYQTLNNVDNLLGPLEFQSSFLRETNNGWVSGRRPFVGNGFYDSAPLEEVAYIIRQKLRYTVEAQNAPHSEELFHVIETITASSISTDIQNYFRNWHKHAPIVHEASFNPCTAALPLILALMGLGGMYSSQEEQVIKLKLVDTIETFIFSLPNLGLEYETPGQTYGGLGSEEEQQHQLEELQGAYLYIVLQYWTGNSVARKRVRQQRFTRVVAIFHQKDLQVIQHPPDFVVDNQQSFRRWVRTESAIRLVTIASMLDNAFAIFNNSASRFQWAEIDFPFPSSNVYFKLANYDEMVSKGRHPTSKMKVKAAFASLLSSPQIARAQLKPLRDSDLTALDLQMLIHYLYTHVWTTVFNSPVLSMPGYSMSLITTSFRQAMANWKALWDELRHGRDEWDISHFHHQADKYYEVINAIIASFETNNGNFPPIPSDCAKGAHLKIILNLE